MIFEYETLKLIWLWLIGSLWIGFIVTGGIDLGICALLPWLGKNDEERRTILNGIGPTWEGNQVWLITAIATIFAAWPFLYAAAFSAFYIILLLILIPLILKPPSIDFRSKFSSPIWRSFWDYCLSLSGFIPAYLFGILFGNLLNGISFNYDNDLMPHITGNFFSLFSPYAMLFGIASLSIIALQGSLFLQLKMNSPLEERAIKSAFGFGIIFIVSFLLLGGWTIFKIEGFQIIHMPNPNESFTPLSKEVMKKIGLWSQNYHHYPLGYLAPFLSVIGVILALIFSFFRAPLLALLSNTLALSSVMITIGFTLFPFILPSSSVPNHSLTIWDAVSSKLTLTWMLWATLIFLPIIFSYTSWVFHVTRGKVKISEFY